MNSSFYRKVVYVALLAVLLFPLARLGAPSTSEAGDEGGVLAQSRRDNKLGQADLGAIDPASETIRMATLGLRGLAVSMLWSKANDYKKTEDWTSFQSTLEQLARLQPYFIAVWRFQSWNLSYNVSVELDDVRDRFYYVKQGIQYLMKGILYNRDSPYLLDDLGWFHGNKIGRADEHVQYRRLFKLDDDLNPPERPPEMRDNWLVSKEWYKQAIAAVDDKHKPMGNKNPTTFFDCPARSQMSYAEAIEDEGVYGPRAKSAWSEGARLWRDYGARDMKASQDVTIRLGDLDKAQAEDRELQQQLEELSPDLRERMKKEAMDSLSDKQRKAWDETQSGKAAEDSQAYEEASKILDVTIDKVAARIAKDDPSKASQARRLASRIDENNRRVTMIQSNRDVSNYAYWQLRCDLEQAAETLKARELAHEAARAFKDADLPGSRKLYEQSFDLWAKALDEYPKMQPDSPTGSDIMEFVDQYVKVLEQMDLSLADKDVADGFALWKVVEVNDQERHYDAAIKARKARQGGGQTPGGESNSSGAAGQSVINPADVFSDPPAKPAPGA